MPRLSSYRDFDWVLLGFVLLLSLISVLEIKSATLQTKFHGFDHKQIQFLAVGLVLMFIVSLIDYHRLIDIIHWAYGISIVSLIAVLIVGTKVLGGRRWIKFPGGIGDLNLDIDGTDDEGTRWPGSGRNRSLCAHNRVPPGCLRRRSFAAPSHSAR